MVLSAGGAAEAVAKDLATPCARTFSRSRSLFTARNDLCCIRSVSVVESDDLNSSAFSTFWPPVTGSTGRQTRGEGMLALITLTIATLVLNFWPESLAIQQGQTATASLHIEGARDLYAAEVSVTLDNPRIARVVGMQPDGVLTADTTQRDGRDGRLAWSRTGQTQGFTGNGHLVTIELEALSPGATALRLSGGSFYTSQGEQLDCELSPEPVMITVTRAPLSERLAMIAKSNPLAVGFLAIVAAAVLLVGIVMIIMFKRLWATSTRT
jgi:hypothetical protein